MLVGGKGNVGEDSFAAYEMESQSVSKTYRLASISGSRILGPRNLQPRGFRQRQLKPGAQRQVDDGCAAR